MSSSLHYDLLRAFSNTRSNYQSLLLLFLVDKVDRNNSFSETCKTVLIHAMDKKKNWKYKMSGILRLDMHTFNNISEFETGKGQCVNLLTI